MRKIIVIIIVCFFGACSKETLNEDLIIGKWKLIEVHDAYEGGWVDNRFKNSIIIFNTDKTVNRNYIECVGEYEIIGDVLNYSFPPCYEEIKSFKMEFEKKNLILTVNKLCDYACKFKFKKL